MVVMKNLLVILFLLLPSTVLAQEEIICCVKPPITLVCEELKRKPHTTEYSKGTRGDVRTGPVVTITVVENGIISICGCSYPYASCGLSVGPGEAI